METEEPLRRVGPLQRVDQRAEGVDEAADAQQDGHRGAEAGPQVRDLPDDQPAQQQVDGNAQPPRVIDPHHVEQHREQRTRPAQCEEQPGAFGRQRHHRDRAVGAGDEHGDHGVVGAAPHQHRGLAAPRAQVVQRGHAHRTDKAQDVQRGHPRDQAGAVVDRRDHDQRDARAEESPRRSFVEDAAQHGPGAPVEARASAGSRDLAGRRRARAGPALLVRERRRRGPSGDVDVGRRTGVIGAGSAIGGGGASGNRTGRHVLPQVDA